MVLVKGATGGLEKATIDGEPGETYPALTDLLGHNPTSLKEYFKG